MPPFEPVARLLTRLDEARRRLGPSAVLAFDADGTLWEGDVGHDTFHALLSARAVREAARAPLAEEARRHRLPDAGDATDLAAALYEAYLAGRYPEDRACSMMAWVFAGFTRDECDAFAREALGRVGLTERVHGEVEPVLAWARAEGVSVWIVSASPRAPVEAGARLIGLDPRQVVAATPAEGADGVLLPRTLEPMPYDEGKAEGL
ncbi:MAG TPA: HAD family hydrolase, partial [Polyangiaceae bacterium]|nr:HAD family hydrolase [Polyangiaceae bacterium]